MKIYGIIKSSGTYDDYRSYIHDKLFTNLENAEDEKRKIMDDIKKRKDQADRCDKCRYYEDYEDFKKRGLSDEEFKNHYLQVLDLKCCTFDIDETSICCENWTYDDEDHEPKIEEYELV